MTRKQIYKTIAEAYYCEPELRTVSQRWYSGYGLCHAYARIDPDNENSYYARSPVFLSQMATEIHPITGYWLPNSREDDDFTLQHDLIRADFAWLMYLLTDKEYGVISK